MHQSVAVGGVGTGTLSPKEGAMGNSTGQAGTGRQGVMGPFCRARRLRGISHAFALDPWTALSDPIDAVLHYRS